jgi:hypothetical protein
MVRLFAVSCAPRATGVASGFHHRRRMRRVCGTAQEIKLRRIIRVVLSKETCFRSHRQINAVQLFERERFSVGNDLARAADVDRAKLAAFEKKCAAGFLVVWQLNGFAAGITPPTTSRSRSVKWPRNSPGAKRLLI